MTLQSPIGILGGTFDPIHLGHLAIATAILENTAIKKIKFIPCYQPVHRLAPEANVHDRLAMLKLALKPYSQFCLDEREINRKEPSFMIDTLISLRKDYPNHPLALIIGADAFLNLTSWKRWQELFDYAHMIVVNRPFFNLHTPMPSWMKERFTEDKQKLTQKLGGDIVSIEVPPNPISATNIRQGIRNHQDISDKVPQSVLEYIQAHHLYSQGLLHK